VSGCAGDMRDMRARHFWGFPLYRPGTIYGHCWTEKGCFPTLQPSSKTKISVQA